MSFTEKKSNRYLSKSLFIRGLQCHKSLYLKKYQPELAEEPSEYQQAKMESGQEVGIIAQGLFPGGVEVPYEGLNYDEQLEKTNEAIEAGYTVYEGAFSYDNIFIKADILHKGPDGWELYEVKNSTKVKEYHENDLAVQYYVLKNAGISVSKTYLVHINNRYVRNGEIEVDKLFTMEDLTDLVKERENFVRKEIAKMRKMLKGDMPQIDIGSYCDDPYECDFSGHCWKDIGEGSVFDLAGNGKKSLDLYHQGIKNLTDIPLDILPNGQRIQVECARDKSTIFDKEQVREFLDSLRYPLYFLDFETFVYTTPPYDGMSPYQQMPFQYSLYVQKSEKARLEHYEYIAQPNTDPRRELLEKLLREIPQGSCGLAYNASFEVIILNNLALWFPEYKDTIAKIIENIIDLAIPFRSKHVYSWEMNGSWSQKDVLPALVPGLSYDGMEIANGGMAVEAYSRMCASENPKEIERIRKSLLQYCRLDTQGMVRILDTLKEMTSLTTMMTSDLSEAIEAGKTAIVKECLEQGDDPNAIDIDGWTGLLIAAHYGRVEISKLLIEYGANVNITIKNDEGIRNALGIAKEKGHQKLIEVLRQAGAKTNSYNINQYAGSGSIPQIKEEIADDADVNSIDNDGDTPLLCALTNGHENVAEYLINLGADIKAINDRGYTSLHCAAKGGCSNAILSLLKAGMDIDEPCDDGTPLVMATEAGKIDAVLTLINNGADVNALRGNTSPLMKASFHNYVDIAKILLERGAGVNAVNRDNDTALHYAAGLDNTELIQVLLHYGADVNFCNRDGTLPLMDAALSRNSKGVAKMLLDNGAAVNAADWSKETALHYTARSGNLEVLQVLLKYGADVKACNSEGKAALDIAKESGHIGVVDILEQYTSDQNK